MIRVRRAYSAARRFFVAALLLLSTGWFSPVVAAEVELPRTVAWSAYNLGTTGYNQAVAIGKALKEAYGVNLRVIPGKNDISRLLPLRRGRVQFTANGIATYIAQEGVFQFAHPSWGPLKVRLLIASNSDANQSLGVAADTGVTSFAQLRGLRIPWVRGAPSLNVNTEAMLACGGLTWDDVERVDYPGYDAMWTGVVNNQIDAAFANTVSGPTRRLEASPRGIIWPTLPHDDDACWERLTSVGPYFTRHVATRGAAISAAQPHEGATYPYPLLTASDTQDDDLVYSMTRAIVERYDDYKSADPGANGWAVDRQVFDWVVPYHAGAVRYWREIGVGTDELDAHNNRLIERQDTLAAAWQAFMSTDPDEETLADDWLTVRRAALAAAGFSSAW